MNSYLGLKWRSVRVTGHYFSTEYTSLKPCDNDGHGWTKGSVDVVLFRYYCGHFTERADVTNNPVEDSARVSEVEVCPQWSNQRDWFNRSWEILN